MWLPHSKLHTKASPSALWLSSPLRSAGEQAKHSAAQAAVPELQRGWRDAVELVLLALLFIFRRIIHAAVSTRPALSALPQRMLVGTLVLARATHVVRPPYSRSGQTARQHHPTAAPTRRLPGCCSATARPAKPQHTSLRHAGPAERVPASQAAAAAHDVGSEPAAAPVVEQQDVPALKRGTIMGAVALITGSTVGAG